MPGDITQRLGFDASKAVQELIRLRGELNTFKQSLQSVSGALRKFPSAAMPAIKTFRELSTAAASAATSIQSVAAAGGAAQAAASITSSFNQAGQSFNKVATAAKTSSTVLQGSSAQMATSAQQIGDNLKKVGVAGKKAATDISISWKTITRVIQAQIIVRALSAISGAFRDAHDAARDFSVSIAEIDTLAEGALGSTQQMSAAVRELAQNLGSEAADVAAGVYQTLSNQVVTTGESLEFTAAAAKLAVATQSELGLAVDALSSIMNSYNLEASEAERVSDVLFRTVDLGRLRLEEFGAVLGRVSPLTAALGISYQEMAAAIAALTQKGVPAHTAITQLTQVTQKLLRPTEKLMKLYEEWGVETGAEAIERFGGLQGVLLKMKDATAGNDTAFADLLGRVRAIVGALNLTSNEANALDDAMRQMTEGVNVTSDAFDTIRESSGRKSIEAWNNLKTAMLEVGDTLLEITTPMAKGLRAIVDNMKSVVAVTSAVGLGFLALRAQAAAGAAQMGILSLSIKGVGVALATIGPIALLALAAFLAIKIGEVWADWADTATESAERIANAEKAMTAEHARNSQARIEALEAEFAEQTKYAGRFFTEMSQMYRKDVSEFETRSKIIGKVLEGTLEHLLKKRADAVKIVRDAVMEADEAIKSSAEKQATAQGKLNDLNFKRHLRRLGARRAAAAIHQRAEQTAARAAQAFAKAGANEEAQAGARKLSQLAETRAAEDASHQKTLGNFRGIKKAEGVLEGILKTRIAGEKIFQVARTKLRDAEHKAELARIEEAGAAYEVLAEKLTKLLDPAGKTGAQMAEDTKRIAELLPEFAKSLQGAFDFDAFESLGLPEGLDQLKFGVAKAFDQATFDWSKAADEFQSVLTSREYNIPVKIVITNEGFIAERVKQFGETDLFGDPGKLASQNLKVAQSIVKTNEAAEDVGVKALASIKEYAATVRTIPTATVLQKKGFFGINAAAQQVGESVNEYHKRIVEGVPMLEKFRQKMISIGDAMEDQAFAGRGVTDEIRDGLEEIRKEAIQLGKEHYISPDGAQHIKTMFAALIKEREALNLASEAQKIQESIPIGTYEAALDLSTELGGEAKQQVLTEELLGTEKFKTNTAVQRSIEAQKLLNQGIKEGVTAINSETTAVDALTTAYEGAAEASNQRWEITQQPDVAGRPGIEEEGEPASVDALAAQAEAARQLQMELLSVNTEFANVISSASGLTMAVSAPLEPAIQLRDAFTSISQAVRTVSTSMPLITEQLSASSSTANALTIALTQSASAASATNQATNSIASSLANAASAGNTMAASMKAAAAAATAAAQACAKAAKQCAGGSVNASHGGRFFAAGGRGTDTIPAMLTPGEFVVNARSARDFFPQLQAINAGQQPTYRDQGGSVTNTTIGDVNVTVQGGESSSQTIREIGNGLRRELRRKTVKLY